MTCGVFCFVAVKLTIKPIDYQTKPSGALTSGQGARRWGVTPMNVVPPPLESDQHFSKYGIVGANGTAKSTLEIVRPQVRGP
jgi:hypothetical protein